MSRGRVLVIAGSDSGGGAGLQADLKTITVMGGYGASAVTALTAQNTQGVNDILDVPGAFIRAQIHAVLSDIGADCLKTGMLHRRDIIEIVAEMWEAYGKPTLVVDPVMVAKGGARLLQAEAVDALQHLLLPAASLLTPNLPEAGVLMGREIERVDDMKRAADWLMDRGARAVLLKGGHGQDNTITDLLAQQSGFTVFENERIVTPHTHGTGCTLASAIATGLARGIPIVEAVALSIDYVRCAIDAAPGLGQGHGPLNHRADIPSYLDTHFGREIKD